MRITSVLFASALACFGLGCSHVVREINKQWPPKTTCDDQLKGLQMTQAALTSINAPNFYVGVEGRRLNSIAQAALTQHQVPLIQKVSVSTGIQELIFNVEFAGRFDTLPTVYAAGSAIVHVVPTIEQNHLVLRPTFDRIKLRSVKYKKHEVPGDVVQLLNNVLKTYVNNLNGAIQPQQILFATNVVHDVDPKAILANDKLATNVHGAPLRVNIQLARSALLVDPAGVHVVGELKEDVQAAASPAVTTASATNCDQDLKPLYNAVRSSFLAVAAPLGNETTLAWNDTSASVATEFLRTTINDIGQHLFFGVTYAIPTEQVNFGPTTIATDPAPNLNCSNLAPNYHQQNCSQIPRHCHERGCPSNCGTFDFGCHAEKAACELQKAAERAACEARYGAEVAACHAWNALDKARAEAEVETKKLACRANQEWLNAWQNTPIGDVKGYFKLRDTTATVDVSKLQVSNDFTSVSLTTALRGESGVDASINFQPKDLGYIACQAPWSAGVQARIAVTPTSNVPLTAALRRYRGAEGELVIAADLPGKEFQAEFAESPVLSLFFQNPHVVVACIPGTFLGLNAQLFGSVINAFKPGTAPDLLARTFKFSTNQLSLPVTLPPLEIGSPDLPTVKVRLFPRWDTTALRYTE